MTQLIVQVSNLEKGRLLYELLASLDFVTRIESDLSNQAIVEKQDSEPADFFTLLGSWQGREISQEQIRQQAWPPR